MDSPSADGEIGWAGRCIWAIRLRPGLEALNALRAAEAGKFDGTDPADLGQPAFGACCAPNPFGFGLVREVATRLTLWG
jgi:hypothetical protein